MSQNRKVELEKELKKNDHTYCFFVPTNNKSEVWKKFQLIKNAAGEEQGFAQCNSCKALLSYNSKCGTGSLLRHKCQSAFSVDKSQKTLHYYAKAISNAAKLNLHKQQLKFITKDIRPFCVTEGKFNFIV